MKQPPPPPPPPPQAATALLHKGRLSPYLFTLLAFILFVTILYGEDFSCILLNGQPDYSLRASHLTLITKKKGEKLPPFAVEWSPAGCDVFSGRWVWDPAAMPLYEEEECPYIQPQLTCQGHGRPDKDYQHWRWQPHRCSLPRFSHKTIL